MKIKITLINPPLSLKERYGKDLDKFGAITEPLGLAYLAANLEKNDYPVSIIDSVALGLDVNGVLEELVKENPDLVGITVLTPMYDLVKELVNRIREAMPKVKIILGGAHATALPKETLSQMQRVDYICVGEGENTLLELARFLSCGGNVALINGLVYRHKEGKLISNLPRKFEMDLDKFPPPARHLLPMKKYHLTASRVKGKGYCPTLILARGCPFNCAFCSHPFGRSFRHHSVERIISELENVVENYNAKEVNFEADTLTIDKSFLLALCQKLGETGLNKKIRWTCESRVDTIDKELLQAIKKAGCWQISYGIESGAQRLLNLINKGTTLKKIEEVVALTKKIGISIRGFFILGLPTETIKESWQTIKFAKKLDPLWAQFTVTIPFPGTPLFDLLKKQGQIRHFNWSQYSTWGGWSGKRLPFIDPERKEEELKRLQKQAMVAFYLRPKVVWRFLKTVNSPAILKKYLVGFFILIKNLFNRKESYS